MTKQYPISLSILRVDCQNIHKYIQISMTMAKGYEHSNNLSIYNGSSTIRVLNGYESSLWILKLDKIKRWKPYEIGYGTTAGKIIHSVQSVMSKTPACITR